jgi:hypothetical protein
MKGHGFVAALLAASVRAWMPEDRELEAFNRTSNLLDKRAHSLPSWKIRGVNLGGWLISEPWMMNSEWSDMGCSGKCSEFDCVNALGQSQADSAFNAHYARYAVNGPRYPQCWTKYHSNPHRVLESQKYR